MSGYIVLGSSNPGQTLIELTSNSYLGEPGSQRRDSVIRNRIFVAQRPPTVCSSFHPHYTYALLMSRNSPDSDTPGAFAADSAPMSLGNAHEEGSAAVRDAEAYLRMQSSSPPTRAGYFNA